MIRIPRSRTGGRCRPCRWSCVGAGARPDLARGESRGCTGNGDCPGYRARAARSGGTTAARTARTELEPLELEPLELPQHMLELELLLELLDDTGAMELALDAELPPDPGLLELPHDMAGLSRRAARRCSPKADAS